MAYTSDVATEVTAAARAGRVDLDGLTTLATRSPTWRLVPSQRDDVDLLLSGAYAPVIGFHTREEATSIRDEGHLPYGTPWPTPLLLTVDAGTAAAASAAGWLALTDDDGTLLAVLEVVEEWADVVGAHLGGPVHGVRHPRRWDFPELRRPFTDLLAGLAATRKPVLVAQPTGVVDARTAARWGRAAAALGARLLVLPAVGADTERRHVTRVRAYRTLLKHLPSDTLLQLLPSGRHPADPAAAALHAVVANNLGGTHLLLEGAVDADVIAGLGLEPIDPADHAAPTDPPAGELHQGAAAEVRRGDPPRSDRGFVVMLSGLSGSGKSTVAKALRACLSEAGDRQVSLLDGDLVRQHLSSELGFSKAHRDLNVRRIGYVASEIAKHGGIAICAPIAPYDLTRRQVREDVEAAGGGFVLVHVATPLEVCEQRDVKGLYAKARAGELTGFTGIDDPYEVPQDAEVTIDTSALAPVDAAGAIVSHLVAEGWVQDAIDRRREPW